jgi:hypothetical protein
MAKSRTSARRPQQRLYSSQNIESLTNALDREFSDYVSTRRVPEADDRRGRERYLASLRRTVAANPFADMNTSDVSHAEGMPSVFGGGSVMDLVGLVRSRFTAGLTSPIRLGDGLYDFYPPELPAFGLWHARPYGPQSLVYAGTWPTNSSITLSVPQVGVGKFYSSASTFQNAGDRSARVWCGTYLPVDPSLHDSSHGEKDIVVWAEGTISYDYALSATPGPMWNGKPEAASAQVNILARLLRYSRQTGQLMADQDAILSYFAALSALDARLVPNGATSTKPGERKQIIGGPYAAWSTPPTNFSIELNNGKPRKLETDSIYLVAIVCEVILTGLAAGQAPAGLASAEVSAQMFLRRATLGIFAHDPSVPF